MVGLARNCEKSIREDINRIKNAIGISKSLVWLIVESDSSDQTLLELRKLQSELSGFNYVSFGELAKQFPKRTERIARCRNYYAEQIRSNRIFKSVDYVIVADLDGLNIEISQIAFESCWTRYDWDMCAANQNGPYYDIYALRHKVWCPGDCWAQYEFLNKYSHDFEKNIRQCVHSKMITIPQDSEWIEVDSAFGGFAIYKKTAFDYCEYVGINEAGEEFCEHVNFHKKLRDHGAKLFINPRLINASLTEHTTHLLLRNRIKQKIKYTLKELYTIGFELSKLLMRKVRTLLS